MRPTPPIAIYFILAILIALPMLTLAGSWQHENIALHKPVYSSSEASGFPGSNAVNGQISRDQKWMTVSEALPPHILEIDLQKYYHIDRVVVHSGIPEEEWTAEESLQAAGFWAIKHFALQYWDDANWTDIPGSEVTENRQTSNTLEFAPGFTTFKIRFIAWDAEPLNLMEIEVFGQEVPNMTVPESGASDMSFERNFVPEGFVDATLKVSPQVVGKSMKYVGYNQAYYLPGSNVSGWLEYAMVNSLRVWTSLGTYVPPAAVQVDAGIASLDEFERRKAELRRSPENNRFIDWTQLEEIYSTADMGATNAMVFTYALEETRRLGIDIILQINERNFEDNWSHKWQQWQRFYALAYFAAREGDVFMFSMQNEPNHRHSGPMTIEEWLRGMQVVSDAVRSAIEDVNRIYDKTLVAQFAGPVTAGTNVDWWAEVLRNVRIDYRGHVTDYDLIDIFSTHSYNSPAVGYQQRAENIREIIRTNHPEGKEIPVVFTEIGRWMNAYLIDKEETMDSPSLFTEWAGIYTNNMLNGSYGMWAFKLASNTSPTYPRGIKSGHHFVWNGKRVVEDAYENIALSKPVHTHPYFDGSGAASLLTDGVITDESGLIDRSAAAEKWVAIDLLQEETIGSAIIYTGSYYGVFTGPDRIRNFKLQYKSGDEWIDIPGAKEVDCKYVQVLLLFDKPVTTRQVRFIAHEEGPIMLREIKLYRYLQGPDTAPESFDISGVHRTGEVVRLFAKGFKEQRDLLETTVSVKHSGLDACTSFDPNTGNYYIWLVQRALFDYHFTLDLSGLNISEGHPVISELVGPMHYGSVHDYLHTGRNALAELVLPAQSVMLITIPGSVEQQRKMIHPSANASVTGGRHAARRAGRQRDLQVSLDASDTSNNQVTYIHFDAGQGPSQNASLAILGLYGHVEPYEDAMRIHVYGMPSEKWKERQLTWNKAPGLSPDEALINHVGDGVFIAGQLAFDKDGRYHYLDVTSHVNKYHEGLTFMLIRETRHMGDYLDKGRKVNISGRRTEKPPVLIRYLSF